MTKRLILLAALISLAGCAEQTPPAAMAVAPTTAPAGRSVTLIGWFSRVDYLNIDHDASGKIEPLFVPPGRHTLYFGQAASSSMVSPYYRLPVRGVNGALSITLNFPAMQTYEFTFSGPRPVLKIHNVTTTKDTYFDTRTMVYFDESRKPINMTDAYLP